MGACTHASLVARCILHSYGRNAEQAALHAQPRTSELVHSLVFELAQSRGWKLQAWAVLVNHYHFVAIAPEQLELKRERAAEIASFIRALHSKASIEINRLDGVRGRKVFYQYWDTELTYEESYFARLHYVHRNPERHGVVPLAENYPWCSMGWFKSQGDTAFVRSVLGFKIDKVNVYDDF